ncbi:sensor histidine kinase [Croceibacterium ferulae]|uniref:sensor histidine kinase n=1 Tax=Croceibacterium ferulae TaxID=1854641 RepID=UPI000EB10271|nr:sensor histidine kinase KdpD [Croceibacterium ferulae]
MTSATPRPSPEALLKAARQAGRGRLKIILGAAPGVGKTYEMLLEGAEAARAGRDVVVGVVETHGRADTAALVTGLEVLPRRTIAHGAHSLAEFDLDAMLARRPQVALVDEYAHSNAPGSRHPKRWQDVEELRDAGIDVITTLNIQHLESLNDVVAGFTRVRVRETVPDALLDDAEIEVVDLPPDELIVRLQDGKVYLPEEATRALTHFFSKSNLSALRELALRRAAMAVDRQMLDHVRLAGEPGLWAAGERVVVAVGDQPGADALVRSAKRLADALHAPWTALTIETSRSARLPDATRARIADALKLAGTLGATLTTVSAASVVEGVCAHLAESRATAVVIGKTRRSWWFELRHRSVVDQLVRMNDAVAVHVVPLPAAATQDRTGLPLPTIGSTGAALLMIALTTMAGLLLQPWLGPNAIDLLYLVPVVAAATLLGLRASLVASVSGALAYNFFFLPPIRTLSIAEPQNVLTFVILAGVGITAAQLAGRLRQQANVGARSATENAALAAFGQRLASVADEGGTAAVTCSEIANLLDLSTVLLLRREGRLHVAGSAPGQAVLGPLDITAAEWAWDRGEPAGRDTATLTASDWQFHPLATSLGVLAVLGISHDGRGDPLPASRRVLFATLLGQAALAHERLQLEGKAREMAALKQRDDLRATLISSLGHDLKTPLTSVLAAADALAHDVPGNPAAATLKAEGRRLARLFDDLVEMTRIEAGALAIRPEPIDLTDAVAAAVHDLGPALATHPIRLDVPVTLPLVMADPGMLHHMLINLIDNAAKYSPAGAPITVAARRDPQRLVLSVLDAGSGLPPGSPAELFRRFARGQGSDGTGGTGLGLAIVQGFADAMGLVVRAAPRSDGTGSCFAVEWPEALIRRLQDHAV